MSTIAIVVARGGSTRLPNKALLPFAGVTLIAHKVRTLKACPAIDRVIVGSDSEAILMEAVRHGAESVRRDDYHCDERVCSANEMIADMVGRVPGLADDDVVVWAHPTNPLVRAETYAAAVQEFGYRRASGQNDSLMSVTPVRRHAWSGDRPLNYNPWAPVHTFASQLDPIRFQDGAIFIQTAADFRRTRYFFGREPYPFDVPWQEGWDVDDLADFKVSEALWQAYGSSS
jgi:CMP-N,N'-diacetyllegionaminic acid synthase